jgi:hypothetical protein
LVIGMGSAELTAIGMPQRHAIAQKHEVLLEDAAVAGHDQRGTPCITKSIAQVLPLWGSVGPMLAKDFIFHSSWKLRMRPDIHSGNDFKGFARKYRRLMINRGGSKNLH